MSVPMIRELSRLRDEVARLLEIYTEHASSQDEALRRRKPADTNTVEYELK